VSEIGTSRQTGTVYTFYSFKGGVGRSMALANVAVLLARWGKRVLAVDFDLEAPGLDKYFAEYIPDGGDRRDVPGLVDLVTEFLARRKATWRDHLIHVTIPGGASIDFLAAGRADPSYVSRLSAIDWHELFEEHRFGDVLEDMRSEWIAAYDFVLVDSRTGFTDTGGICTIHLPDVLVALFTANHQNLEGMREVMRQARRGHSALPFDRSPLLVLPVPARDETDNEYVLAGEWRTRFASELKGLFDDWAPQNQAIDKLLDFVKLPYFPYWSFGERLPVLHEDASNPKTLAGSFAFLAKLVLHRLDWDQAVTGEGAAAAELAAIEARLRNAQQAESEARSGIVLSPYPGLRPFSTDDAMTFFGRDAEIQDIVRRLDAGEREIYITGPSGCGKSSLIFAGVLPRLVRGTSGLRTFVVRTMRPGDSPTRELAQVLDVDVAEPAAGMQVALSRVADGASLLLIIDQFEEIFSLASPAVRVEFMSALQVLRADPRSVLLGVVRADHLAAFLDSPFGVDLDRRSAQISLAPMPREALREVIIEPARTRGVDFELDLVERLLADGALEPGSLPFLQATLRQLWEGRCSSRITLADYEHLGGAGRGLIAAAISSQADAALRALPSHQQVIVRRILLRLVSFDEGRSSTRRQQPVEALRTAASDASEFDGVLAHLIASRLLFVSAGDSQNDPRADLAHESLIDAWPTMTAWIVSLRASEEFRRRVETAAQDWVHRERSADGLLDPAALAEVEAWRRTEGANELGESTTVAEFITASQVAHKQARRRQRRTRLSVLALAASWMLLAAGLVFSVVQGHTASNEAQLDRERSARSLAGSYRELGRQLLLDGRAPEALPYLVAARENGEDGWLLRLLFATAIDEVPLVPPLEPPGFVYSAAFSPDGTRVITASEDHTAHIWDARTAQPVASLPHEGAVYSAVFSADGRRVVTGSADHTARVWESATGKSLTPPLVHRGLVHRAAFSSDGTRVVTVSDDFAARVWESATGKPLTPPLMHDGTVNSAAFSPDGSRIVTASADHTARIWDVATGKPLTPLMHEGAVNSAAFSPDGSRIVTASADHTARIWDAATGKPLPPALMHTDAVNSVAFSPGGSRVATASADHTARIWDAATGKPVTAPLEHRDAVASISFSSDGTRVITASADRTAKIWSAVTGEALYPALEHAGAVSTAAFSPSGSRAITASTDHTRIWNATAGEPRSLPLEHAGPAISAAFNRESSRVVIARDDGTARIHDTATGAQIVELRHGAKLVSVVFSPDGSRVATAGGDQLIRIWASASGAPLAAFRCDGTVNSVEFSPGDGALLVAASDDRTARVWGAATGLQVAKLSGHEATVRSAVFSADGKLIATAGDDHTARIWNATTGVLLVTLSGHQATVNSAVFSPRDGSRLVTASDDKTVRVWDTATGRQLIVLAQQPGSVRSAAFSPDGTFIIANVGRTVHIWDATTGRPLPFPLATQQPVVKATFSRDGTRFVTTGPEVWIWTWSVDAGTPRDWSAAAERSPFRLDDGVLVLRTPTSGKLPEIDPPLTPRDR
jgi:WD40 repeat protein/cellulose biosynthesis protein BcsQ